VWVAEIDGKIIAKFSGDSENIQKQKEKFLHERGIIFEA